MQVDYISSNGEGVSGHAWTLRARTVSTLGFAVPTFQNASPGAPSYTAVDITPVGATPTENASNGFTWLDCMDTDIILNPTAASSAGRVGIRTINGAAAGYVGTIPFNGAPAGNFWIITGTDAHPRWGVAYNGNFLPYEDNTYSLGLSGNRATAVYAVNGTIQTSDEREKTDIEPTKLGLDFINALSPVTFRWKSGSDKSRHQGILAQNVMAAANGEPCGVTDEDGRLHQNYSELIASLIKAVQELSIQVRQLTQI